MEYLAILLFSLIPLAPFITMVVGLFKSKWNEPLSLAVIIPAMIILILYPFLYLAVADFTLENSCCFDTAAFSPQHRPSIYIWITLSHSTGVYSIIRTKILPPIPEILFNSLLYIGIIINISICFHIGLISLIGNVPIIILLIYCIIRNHKQQTKYLLNTTIKKNNKLVAFIYRLLTSKWYFKQPIILILVFPIALAGIGILLLFGQEPDSIIRAFTDTYKSGFSQLDYLCANVDCGGHYLCSVAANGNKKLVKPKRYGKRNNNLIICNRLLLVSNAFEELLEEKLPSIHKLVRRKYDKVGDLIHRERNLFSKKWVSNVTYILMKPAELLFNITLYCFYKNPENRIALQYVDWGKKKEILKQMK